MAEPVQRERYHATTLPNGALSLAERTALQKGFQSIQRATQPQRIELYGTQPPTAGTWPQGTVTWNLASVELGTPGSKYVIDSWKCTVAGTPGTWVEQRALTGN